jgi:transposase
MFLDWPLGHGYGIIGINLWEKGVQMPAKSNAESIVKDIKRMTRKKYSAEEKIRIVLEGLRGEEGIATICRREGISPNLYYRWSKEFLEAGKKRLLGDTQREATNLEVKEIRKENEQLKQLVAELLLKNRVLKKSVTGME